jgi:hypothetical protein
MCAIFHLRHWIPSNVGTVTLFGAFSGWRPVLLLDGGSVTTEGTRRSEKDVKNLNSFRSHNMERVELKDAATLG